MSDEIQKTQIIQATRIDLNAGKVVFGRFSLEREVGSGGMGVVWLAKDLEVEGRVALKFLPGLVRDATAERDLRDEVKNARDLVHENIVSVRTLHKDETSIAVEMEYVDGPNITALLQDLPNRFMEVAQAAPIARGLCLAIDHAWSPPRRLVHRDIKPHNLLVNAAGQVKVVDFGIAHTVSETITRLTGQTQSERVVGTLPYMSPQQLKGEVHHANDIYSIGATIYHVLTGTPPFRASDPAVLTQQINNETPASMTERRRQLEKEPGRRIAGMQAIPKIWEETVAACLEKNVARRPASAREIAERLGLVEARRRSATDSASGGKSRKAPVAIAAVGVLALAGAAGWYFLGRTQVATPAVQPAVATPAPTQVVQTPGATAAPARSDQPVAVAAPAEVAAKSPPPAPVVLPPRQNWSLVAPQRTRLVVSRESDQSVEFDGVLAAGEKHTLPVDAGFFVQVKEGAGLALEVDGKPVAPPSATSGRWLVNVPAAADVKPSIAEAALPFEPEVGPLIRAGTVNEFEAGWLRAALGGDKGAAELTLVRRIFAPSDPITIGQWRAKTELKFKPDAAALNSSDRLLQARAIDLQLSNGGIEMRLLRIEPGKYVKGSPPAELGRSPGDATAGNATVAKPFFIGIYEVTQSQYESVMTRSPSYWRGNPAWPVDQVTWSLLMGAGPSTPGFIPALNAILAKSYDGSLVADLPTDDEWEYAGRAGTTTAFNSGQDITKTGTDPALDALANYNKAGGTPRPVGSFRPNAWGLYDMHGNLQEWTKEFYLRGGSYQSTAAGSRSAARVQTNREAGPSQQTGFRLVLRFREAK